MAYNVGNALCAPAPNMIGRAQTTTHMLETSYDTRGNDLEHRNNFWDWVFRG